MRLADRSSLSPELHTLDRSAACPGRGTSTPEGPDDNHSAAGTPIPTLTILSQFVCSTWRRFLVAHLSLRQLQRLGTSLRRSQRPKTAWFQRGLPAAPSTEPRALPPISLSPRLLSPKAGNYANLVPSLGLWQNQCVNGGPRPAEFESVSGWRMQLGSRSLSPQLPANCSARLRSVMFSEMTSWGMSA